MKRIRDPTLFGVKISAKGENFMAKRKITPAQELQQHVDRLAERHARWERERRDGCVDPFWSDGDNLIAVLKNNDKRLTRGIWALVASFLKL